MGIVVGQSCERTIVFALVESCHQTIIHDAAFISTYQLEPLDVVLAYMVHAPQGRVVIRHRLEVACASAHFSSRLCHVNRRRTFAIIVVLVYPTRADYTPSADIYRPRSAEVPDPRGEPSTMIQLPHVVARFVVAPNHDGQHGGGPLARVVLMECAERVVLRRHG